jgi:2-oxoglutarate dehydrogenase E2 component (dihydrolipoamide succinyltransferase)
VEFRLGELGGDIEYATIAEWRKAVGEPVTAGEIVLAIETDKVVEELESPATGTLAEIVAEEGDEVKVGGLLAVIEE